MSWRTLEKENGNREKNRSCPSCVFVPRRHGTISPKREVPIRSKFPLQNIHLVCGFCTKQINQLWLNAWRWSDGALLRECCVRWRSLHLKLHHWRPAQTAGDPGGHYVSKSTRICLFLFFKRKIIGFLHPHICPAVFKHPQRFCSTRINLHQLSSIYIAVYAAPPIPLLPTDMMIMLPVTWCCPVALRFDAPEVDTAA